MGYSQEIALAKKQKQIGGVPPHLHNTILALLSDEPRGRLLDAMPYRGQLTRLLIKAGFDVVACDLHPENFEVPGVVCQRADLDESMPYRDEEFDYVVLCEAIEHLENPWNLMREAHRVLKPGGRLILSTPNVLSLFSRFLYFVNGSLLYFGDFEFHKPNHINPITYNELEIVFQEAGFEVKNLVGTGHRVPGLAFAFLRVLRWMAQVPLEAALILYVKITEQNKPTPNRVLKERALVESQGFVIKAQKR